MFLDICAVWYSCVVANRTNYHLLSSDNFNFPRPRKSGNSSSLEKKKGANWRFQRLFFAIWKNSSRLIAFNRRRNFVSRRISRNSVPSRIGRLRSCLYLDSTWPRIAWPSTDSSKPCRAKLEAKGNRRREENWEGGRRTVDYDES